MIAPSSGIRNLVNRSIWGYFAVSFEQHQGGYAQALCAELEAPAATASWFARAFSVQKLVLSCTVCTGIVQSLGFSGLGMLDSGLEFREYM